jgi:hypothetical protein
MSALLNYDGRAYMAGQFPFAVIGRIFWPVYHATGFPSGCRALLGCYPNRDHPYRLPATPWGCTANLRGKHRARLGYVR